MVPRAAAAPVAAAMPAAKAEIQMPAETAASAYKHMSKLFSGVLGVVKGNVEKAKEEVESEERITFAPHRMHASQTAASETAAAKTGGAYRMGW